MSEFLDLKKRAEATSVMSTSLMLAFGIGTAQLLVLTVPLCLTPTHRFITAEPLEALWLILQICSSPL